MVYPPKKNFSPLPAGKCGKSKQRSTWQHRQVNEGKSSLEAETVRVLGALRSWQCKKKLSAEKRQETHYLSNEEKVKWIKDYVERETTWARKGIQDAEAAMRQEQEDTGRAENAGLTTWEPEKIFHEMMVAIWDSLSDLASSDDGEDGEDEDVEETEQGKLYEDDELCSVMGTITKTAEQCMVRFWRK